MKRNRFTSNFVKYVKKSNDWLVRFEKNIIESQHSGFETIRPFEDHDIFGNTPLHIASFKGRSECV